MIEISAPAKINLGLHILRRRPDGYHDLESVFLKVGWADSVRAEPDTRFTLACDDASLPVDESNLVLRAARLLSDHVGGLPGASLHLRKRVPMGAGLGGGSSDAAHTLRLLVRLFDLDVAEADLYTLAERIGSDVPFFLGTDAALVEGRGERITPMPAYTLPYFLVIVKPSVSVPTPEAYRHVRPSEVARPNLMDLVTSNDLARWRAELVNDFEASIFPRHPEIEALRDAMLERGAGYAAMSGSGSAVFAVFETEQSARQAAGAFETAGYRTWWGRGARA